MIRVLAPVIYYAIAGASWLGAWVQRLPRAAWFGGASLLAHGLLLSLLLPRDAGREPSAELERRAVEVQFVPPGPENVAERDVTDPGVATTPNAEAFPAAHPAVRLEGDPDSGLPQLVTGDIMPPTPDIHRNIPPAYPAEAARRGAEGTVGLVIHVGATGRALGVEVVHSSGTSSLDRAASDRLRTWRFAPAKDGDRPVPFDYELNIRFVLGTHP